MRFEFAKFTDVTEYAHSLELAYLEYEKVYICPDTNDAWIGRILVGYDDEYNKNPEKVLVERNNIDGYGAKYYNIKSPNYAKMVLQEDDFCNWDVYECESLAEAIELLDDGYGIIEEEV